MTDLMRLDALAQAERVRSGEVSPLELVDAAIAKIEALNPRLNAVVTPMFETAREVAKGPLPDGPLKGVPFLLKDLLAEYAGAPMTEGSRFLKDYISPHDSELVARYKRAGLVVVGKTNTPEFGLKPTTEPELFGPTHNPWNTDHTPGGSSGGSAAAVASGMVSAAHANDGGGSIRGPASWCGLVGMKPTRGRNPLGPDYGDLIGGLVAEHVVTRTVRDSAALLDATSGPDTGTPYVTAPPARPFLAEVSADPGKLKIAFSARSIHGHEAEADCVNAVQNAAKLCESLGHTVVEDLPKVDGSSLTPLFGTLWASFGAWTLRDWEERTGRTATPDQFEKHTWIMTKTDKRLRGSDLAMALQNLQRFARTVAPFFDDYDVWLTPTMNTAPPPLGFFDHDKSEPQRARQRMEASAYFTSLCNVTGQPAMSLPLHQTDDGLPVGVQLIGRFGEESTLYRLAAQLETAQPWADKWPEVS
jgi:amidase